MSDSKEITCSEIEIPVPWGHIAGKIWGNPSDQRVLAIHGKQDNCGVFDRLVPLLNGNYYVVVIDLPGHGLSSHFPAGLPIFLINYVVTIIYVIAHLEWDQFLFLGHSLGGQIGLFFSAIFPEFVKKLVVLDHVSPAYVEDNQIVKNIRNSLYNFLKMEHRTRNGAPPVYTYQDAVNKLTDRDSSLTTEAARIVLQRSLKSYMNGYTFSMDQRLKLNPFPSLTVGIMKEVINNVICPTLIILTSERKESYEYMFSEIVQSLKRKPNVIMKVVPGNHDVHQNHPERVVNLIDEFFLHMHSKL